MLACGYLYNFLCRKKDTHSLYLPAGNWYEDMNTTTFMSWSWTNGIINRGMAQLLDVDRKATTIVNRNRNEFMLYFMKNHGTMVDLTENS
jgi:hypothetical protein